MSKGNDCYLLIGEAANKRLASHIAEQYKNCPHVYFIASANNRVIGIFFLPEERRWWLRAVAKQPQLTLGLNRAAVYKTEVSYPESFSQHQKEVGTDGLSPCGSNCSDCDRFGSCGGCPALRA